MSLPKFSSLPANLEDSVYQILASIAMEEVGMSHIINAEGEKLQYVLGTLDGSPGPANGATIREIYEINDSIQTVLANISINQLHMYNKLNTALNAYRKKKQYTIIRGDIQLALVNGQLNAHLVRNSLYTAPGSEIELDATGTMANGTQSPVLFSLIGAPNGIELQNIENGAILSIANVPDLTETEFQLGAMLVDDPAVRQTWQVKVDDWGRIDLLDNNENPVDKIGVGIYHYAKFKIVPDMPGVETEDITFEVGGDKAMHISITQDNDLGELTLTNDGGGGNGTFTLTASINGWDAVTEWNGAILMGSD